MRVRGRSEESSHGGGNLQFSIGLQLHLFLGICFIWALDLRAETGSRKWSKSDMFRYYTKPKARHQHSRSRHTNGQESSGSFSGRWIGIDLYGPAVRRRGVNLSGGEARREHVQRHSVFRVSFNVICQFYLLTVTRGRQSIQLTFTAQVRTKQKVRIKDMICIQTFSNMTSPGLKWTKTNRARISPKIQPCRT